MTASAAAPPTAPPMIIPMGGLEPPLLVCSCISPVRRVVGVGAAAPPPGPVALLVPLPAASLDSVTLKLIDVVMVMLEETGVLSVMSVLGEDERSAESDALGLGISDSTVVLCPEDSVREGATEGATEGDALVLSSLFAVVVDGGAAAAASLVGGAPEAGGEVVDGGAASISIGLEGFAGEAAARPGSSIDGARVGCS